jgi:hypothetical protein
VDPDPSLDFFIPLSEHLGILERPTDGEQKKGADSKKTVLLKKLGFDEFVDLPDPCSSPQSENSMDPDPPHQPEFRS